MITITPEDFLIKMTGKERIAQERARQVNSEGWTADHDNKYVKEELVAAGDAYLLATKTGANAPVPRFWPWESVWWKPSVSPVRNFEKAGALYQAELDRLKRVKSKDSSSIEWLEIQIKQVAADIDKLLPKDDEGQD